MILSLATCVCALSASSSAALANGVPSDSLLTNKTLVAWVAPANLTQRGGSVLTIEDRRDRFDGIVFGEIRPAVWMAGSDFYRRTQQDQADWPVETATGGTFVQIAMVYEDRRVTVYRDGQRYAEHSIATPPQVFGADVRITVGKRHRRQGDDAHFAGSIDDLRVYDRALTATQIAALKPDEVSVPAPWAWWSFDEAKERTGRFLITQLLGGASIQDGRLVLDGQAGTMIGKTGRETPFTFETPARPATPPPEWLTYHLAHPGPGEAMPGDPNCAFFWKERYHLHYIYSHDDGFAFAHVSSPDLLHWKWHPTTLTPSKTDHGMFSGTGFFTKEGRPAIIYHGQGSGRNQIAIAEDDDLEKWSAPSPLEPIIQPGQDATLIAHWDPDAWLDGDRYYALSGGSPGSGKPPTLFQSPDLKTWEYLGLFLTRDLPDVRSDEDISCPNFFRIGDRHMLLCISHNQGCRYYLGQWKDERFTPDVHARMNWNGWDFFAPESLLTPDGRRVMWAWCNVGYPQSGIQSLGRELELLADGMLRIRPLRELERLRRGEKSEAGVTVRDGVPHRLAGIEGDTLELRLRIRPGTAAQVGLEVFCDAAGQGGFPIVVEPGENLLRLGDVRVPFSLSPGEWIELRVFLDKNLVEVFANDRQAAVASHRHDRDHVGIRLISRGGDAPVEKLTAWRMASIYP